MAFAYACYRRRNSAKKDKVMSQSVKLKGEVQELQARSSFQYCFIIFSRKLRPIVSAAGKFMWTLIR